MARRRMELEAISGAGTRNVGRRVQSLLDSVMKEAVLVVLYRGQEKKLGTVAEKHVLGLRSVVSTIF